MKKQNRNSMVQEPVTHGNNRRSALQIMAQLIGLVRPLLHVMLGAIVLGVIGYLCAICLTILAGQALVKGLSGEAVGTGVFAVLIIAAVLRGVLHYAEQYCNHFIAFKLLAIIRHKVFAALRKLCPAKLEGRDKGNLISIITTDIELLEVFYAHTISPIAIGTLVSLIMIIFIGSYHVLAGGLALGGYVLVGAVIPLWNGRKGAFKGMEYRTAFGELNSFVLDSLRGLDETIQYSQGNKRRSAMQERSMELGKMQQVLSGLEGKQRSLTNLVILVCSFGMLLMCLALQQQGALDFYGVVTCTIAMMGSFGPVVALSNLSNNLHQTLASGERVLSLLEENPMVEEIVGEVEKNPEAGVQTAGEQSFAGASLQDVTFAYQEEIILKDYSLDLAPGRITGIHGASGSGKSTALKLLMRFWDVQRGQVDVNGKDVRKTPTKALREMQSYMTQETHLFHDSIANNIAIAKPDATREEIMEAAKKASIHNFIMSLPKGYDTEVGELGDTLSGGEKQRIGIARAFLHDAPMLLMDEPTSNLDVLNEGIILKSLKEACKDKTVVLVSHRKSTMNVADVVYEMAQGRLS